ncbi:hypothetical protein GEMRC1_008231 [Eukaryota sp. GEM-RC1]
MTFSRSNTIVLFDIDGTLTPPRQQASPEMLALLQQLKQSVAVGVVGGSDAIKQKEQLGESVHSDYDYVFAENGLVAYQNGTLVHQGSMVDFLGESRMQILINGILSELSQIELPFKRGTFVEFRTGMLNVSPVGRSVSQKERDAFYEYDKEHKVREKLITKLKTTFASWNLTFSIGGQVSFDIFPQGWDKTYCLQFVHQFTEIHFFGDKTYLGGNDYEIFADPRVVGHTVTSPEDTVRQIEELFSV